MSGGRYPPGSVELPEYDSPSMLYGGMRYPGRGYPQRPGEDRPMLSAWGRLSRNGALGKKANLVYRSTQDTLQASPVPILEIQGDDADAQQVVVTLNGPRVIATALSEILLRDVQNRSGEQDNEEMQSRALFPGEAGPIEWPPLEALIEWGVGGAQAQASLDFINGQTVSLVCSFLRISAGVVAGTDIGIVGTSAIYTLSAFVGPGYGRTNAHKTTYVGVLTNGAESAVFPIPPFAKYATVVGCDPAATPAATTATLRFWQSPNGVAGGANVGNFVVSGAQPWPFSIPSAAAYASVVNNSGVTTRMSILYTLAI